MVPPTPLTVRDEIIKCFLEAHKKELGDLKNYSTISKEELDSMKKFNVELIVKSKFEEIGSDYDNPTKSDLTKIVKLLADYAKNFRNKSVIIKNKIKIQKLINQL